MIRTAVFVAIVFATCSAHAASIDAQTACSQTIQAYAWHWDHGNADDYVALFTEDGELVLGAPVQGHAAIRAKFASMAPSATMRHLMTNIHIVETDGSVTGTAYALVAGGPKGETTLKSLTVGEYHDVYALQGGRCLFKRREFVTVLRQAPSP